MNKVKVLSLVVVLALLFGACGQAEAPADAQQTITKPEASEPETLSQEPDAPEEAEEEYVSELPIREKALKPAATHAGLIANTADIPRIDGSTACIPLMTKTLEMACRMDEAEADSYIKATGTQNCWDRLLGGKADLVLAYEIPESARNSVSYKTTPLDITPIGRDALVFLVNEDNPVTNVTRQQLIGIYTGQITNWSQLGGADAEIIPYQRDESSGSQTLFRKLLMGDIQPMDPPLEYRIEQMGYLVDAIGTYDNAQNALGYSVYYYVSQMKNEPNVRILSVDGVMPSNETIASGEYSLTNDFFAAIRAGMEEDSGAAVLYRWIISDEGRQCLIDAGYVPAE